MARFELAVRSSNVTTNQAVLEVIAGIKGCRVRSFNITLATGVTGVFGVGRPAAAGITPTTPVPFLSNDGGMTLLADSALSRVALAWGTSPTAPAQYFHRLTVPATVGAIRDIMPANNEVGKGIWVPPGGTLVLFNITGGPTLDVSIDIDG